MDCCAFGSLRPLFPGYLRVTLLWVVQLGAFAQHGEWIENLVLSQISAFIKRKRAPKHFACFLKTTYKERFAAPLHSHHSAGPEVRWTFREDTSSSHTEHISS